MYDSVNNYYNLYDVSYSGNIYLIERMDTSGYTKVDTTFGYHQNGQLAYYKNYFSGYQHGNFNVFDTLGNSIYVGQYYKNVRVGDWYSFSKNGKTLSSVKYNYQLIDSIQLDNILDSIPCFNNYIFYDTLNIYCVTTEEENEYLRGCVEIQTSSVIIGDVRVKTKRKSQEGFNEKMYSDGIIRKRKNFTFYLNNQ